LFILDLRGSELELHRFSVLVQFFTYLSEVYNEFEVWIDKETFLFGGSRLYSKEANDIMELIQCSTRAVFLEKENEKITNNISYARISNGRKLSHMTRSFFQDQMKLKSLPIKYNFAINYSKHPELMSLKMSLKKTFNIVFSPTFDLNQKVEDSSRRYGVISKENFDKLENLYLEIQNRVIDENIHDIKFIFLNKKMFNWQYFPNIIDLRHFEDYGLNFASMLYFVQDNCEWTIGSEGTMQCYLLLSANLKHAIYIDNSHWGYPASDGSTVPLFMDSCDYLKYNEAPFAYIPNNNDVIEKIFNDYYDFKKNNQLQ